MCLVERTQLTLAPRHRKPAVSREKGQILRDKVTPAIVRHARKFTPHSRIHGKPEEDLS